jgi:hypothetical protein
LRILPDSRKAYLERLIFKKLCTRRIMIPTLNTKEITNSLQDFKERRDDLMHEDVDGFDHLAERFLEYCERDTLLQSILRPIKEKVNQDEVDQWWQTTKQTYEVGKFPVDKDEELILRYKLLEDVVSNRNRMHEFRRFCAGSKMSDAVSSFRSLILRPLVSELSRRLGEAANIATPEAREVQAVPLIRIPKPSEIKIFLSHKSKNKEMVRRYYTALRSVGFDPWMDESNMVAGSNLERELVRGFDESCAVVFFMTEHFRDENYLATEIDYAVEQKRLKEKKFAIITLRYPGANEIPRLLTRFIYRDIENDLEGFNEIIKGLPIELGPVRWKDYVVS